MNHLIIEANELLMNGHFDYAFCGGFAIELFLNREIRKHGDIDLSVYWEDRNKIITYMKSLGWNVYEMCGGGVVHHITSIAEQLKSKRNIFCFKNDCELVSLTPLSETDMYTLEFDHKGQTSLNFIEFLFNDKSADDFLYARNNDIKLPLAEAVLYCDKNIPYLAPELVLLYKSTDIQRTGYELDYNVSIVEMNIKQRTWLKNALLEMNPAGHPWIAGCE